MMKGNANFDRRLAKLENSKLGVPANLAGFRAPMITVYEGDDVDQIIKERRGGKFHLWKFVLRISSV